MRYYSGRQASQILIAMLDVSKALITSRPKLIESQRASLPIMTFPTVLVKQLGRHFKEQKCMTYQTAFSSNTIMRKFRR